MIPYLQTTKFTTAASALLSILHNVNNTVLLNKVEELNIWHETVNLPTRGSSIYALASYAHKKGLNPIVVVEEIEFNFPDYRFYRYTKEEVDLAAISEKRHLNKAKKENIKIEKREIKLKEIKKEIIDNKILLLRINTKPIRGDKRNTSNFIVVYDYKNSHFQIIDPKWGAFSISEEKMSEAFETLETKKHRDHRMIIFEKDKSQ
jgi:hypothetical protein